MVNERMQNELWLIIVGGLVTLSLAGVRLHNVWMVLFALGITFVANLVTLSRLRPSSQPFWKELPRLLLLLLGLGIVAFCLAPALFVMALQR